MCVCQLINFEQGSLLLPCSSEVQDKDQRPNLKKNMVIRTLCINWLYNLTLNRLQSRLQRIYHEQPCARIGLNPMPETTISSSQRPRIWSQAVSLTVYFIFIFLFKLSCHNNSYSNMQRLLLYSTCKIHICLEKRKSRDLLPIFFFFFLKKYICLKGFLKGRW